MELGQLSQWREHLLEEVLQDLGILHRMVLAPQALNHVIVKPGTDCKREKIMVFIN